MAPRIPRSFDNTFSLVKLNKALKPANAALFAVWVGTCFIASNAEEAKMNLVRSKMDLPPRERPTSWFTFARWNPDSK